MLLRASGEREGDGVDVRAVIDNAAAAASGVAHAEVLLRFTDAAVRGSDEELASARTAVRNAVGPAGLVDAAAVVGNFERMVRIADATGIPLDSPMNAISADLRSDLGIDRFGSAANSPSVGRIGRALGRALRPLMPRIMKIVSGAVARQRGSRTAPGA